MFSADLFDFEIKRNIRSLNFNECSQRSFKYIGQLSGVSTVSVDGKSYELTEGDAVLVFPYQRHSCHGWCFSCETCEFSPDAVKDFYESYGGLFPKDNLFAFKLPENVTTDNEYLMKAFLYRLCGEFEKKNPKEEVTPAEKDLLISLLLYVEKNFCGKCSLKDAAAELGCDYSYASKYFKEKMKMSFNRHVNTLRIKKSKQMIENGDKSFSEIMLECGFTSLRSFERNFKAVTSLSPSEYREKGSSGLAYLPNGLDGQLDAEDFNVEDFNMEDFNVEDFNMEDFNNEDFADL